MKPSKNQVNWCDRTQALPLLRAEQEAFAALLEGLFGYYLVLMGEAAMLSWAHTSMITHHLWLHPHIKRHKNPRVLQIASHYEALPLADESVDVVLLPHVLEQAPHAQKILNEIQRVLRPEGHLMISGFHPWTWWGRWARRSSDASLCLLSLRGVTGLLGEASFTVLEKRSVCSPQRPGWWGCVWSWMVAQWPGLQKHQPGSVYVVVALKRCVRLKPILPVWQTKPPQESLGLSPLATYHNEEDEPQT